MKAVGYKKSLPIETAEALIDFETAKPEPRGRDIRVAVKAISANPVDYKVRKRAAPPEGETKILGYDAAGVVDAVGPDVTLFKAGDEVFYAGSIQRQGTNSEFHLVDERIVGRKPKSLSFAQAAALPLTSITAWELLFDRLGAVPGKSVDPRTLLIIRRRRRGRLDPDPARPPPYRPHGGRHGNPARIAKMVPRSRRACGDRSWQADEGADRETESGSRCAGRKPHLHRPALQGDRRLDGAARQVRLDRRSRRNSTSAFSRARRSRSTGNRCSRARRSRRRT